MTSPQGWYPDPGGQPGMLRYWDGTSWSEVIRPASDAAGVPGGFDPTAGTPRPGRQPVPSPQLRPAATSTRQGRGSAGPWLILAAALVALAVVVYLVVRGVSVFVSGSTPGTNPTTNPCPVQTSPETPVAHPNDGRVHGGALSYPKLGAPWSEVQTDSRVPFGRDTAMQSITTEPNYQTGSNWMASILVSELVAGDGFYSPQEGSEIVVKCLLGVFYGDAKVDRADAVSQAMTLDGKDAWIVETNLSFSIKGLKATGELVIVVIVATSAESSSLFYASIPNNVPQYVPDARKALAGLRVTG